MIFFVIVAAFVVGGIVLLSRYVQENLGPGDTSASSKVALQLEMITPATEPLVAGDRLEIAVRTNAPNEDPYKQNPSVAELVINFNNEVLEVTELVSGNLIIAMNKTLNNKEGIITIDLAISGDGTFLGTNPLAYIRFDVIKDAEFASVKIDPEESTLGFPDRLDKTDPNLDLYLGVAPIIEPEAPAVEPVVEVEEPDIVPAEEVVAEPEVVEETPIEPAVTTECGNSQCEAGETSYNCPADCVSVADESYKLAICGNGICELDEADGCSSDCQGSQVIAIEQSDSVACTRYLYTKWSDCLDGKQFRSVSTIDKGCPAGIVPIVSRACKSDDRQVQIVASICANDVFTCPGGTVISRSPNQGCQFICPGEDACEELPSCAYGKVDSEGNYTVCNLDPNVNWCSYECTPIPRCAYGVESQATCTLPGGINWCDRLSGFAEDNSVIACRADYDGNGTIGLSDFGIFANNYKKDDIDCDLDIVNSDCKLNIADFKYFGQYYGQLNACKTE